MNTNGTLLALKTHKIIGQYAKVRVLCYVFSFQVNKLLLNIRGHHNIWLLPFHDSIFNNDLEAYL